MKRLSYLLFVPVTAENDKINYRYLSRLFLSLLLLPLLPTPKYINKEGTSIVIYDYIEPAPH